MDPFTLANFALWLHRRAKERKLGELRQDTADLRRKLAELETGIKQPEQNVGGGRPRRMRLEMVSVPLAGAIDTTGVFTAIATVASWLQVLEKDKGVGELERERADLRRKVAEGHRVKGPQAPQHDVEARDAERLEGPQKDMRASTVPMLPSPKVARFPAIDEHEARRPEQLIREMRARRVHDSLEREFGEKCSRATESVNEKSKERHEKREIRKSEKHKRRDEPSL